GVELDVAPGHRFLTSGRRAVRGHSLDGADPSAGCRHFPSVPQPLPAAARLGTRSAWFRLMAKAKKAQIEELNELIEIEADALELYDEALGHIADPHVREALGSIAADHERHVAGLTQIVLDLGGKAPPPPAERDVKGTVVKAQNALRSATGTRGAV